MKKLVWVFGALLALSFVLPDVKISAPWATKPAVVEAGSDVPADAKVASLLTNATAADKARVRSVYSAMATVLKRDGGKLVTTTEQFSLWQANALTVAIDKPGTYPGLDVAIEDCFLRAVGTKDVVSVTPELSDKLVAAAYSIVNAAK